jgi:hypothetical protein
LLRALIYPADAVTSTGSGSCRLAAATALALSVPMLLLSQGLLLLLAAPLSVKLEVISVPLSNGLQ